MNYTLGAPTHFGNWLKGRRKRQKKTMLASLMLTPMVDMFSLLVIFLLQFFSASPDFHLTDGLVLPQSISTVELKEAPVVSVTKDEIFVEHKKIGVLKDVLKNPAPLAIELEGLQATWLKDHPNETFPGEINLEAHQDLESTTVSQLMAVLAAQQYGSIQLVAIGD